MNTKIIAWYLPQYHSIPENDEFWGKGFTDWTTVKRAIPLYKNHHQPRIPLYDNYYDLSIKTNIEWQAKLAKKYGVYGFGIYHYWFNNDKNILTKPANIIHDDKNIDINYLFAWDNASWVRSWSAVAGNAWAPIADRNQSKYKDRDILIPYILGKERDWKNHYSHLLQHFKDDRYIKDDNKPVFIILQYDGEIKKMCDYWNELAKKDGFNGIHFIFKNRRWFHWEESTIRFNYEPHYDGWLNPTIWERRIEKLRKLMHLPQRLSIYSYDTIWKRILNTAEQSTPNELLGAFACYDDSPRRAKAGKIVKGSTPEKFKYYLSKLMEISNRQQKKFLFLTAWNEWGEGAYLEPDTLHKYGYLEAIKQCL